MSFVLNALKRAEKRLFDQEKTQVKKEVFVLRQRQGGGKTNVLWGGAALLGMLALGWFLGSTQYRKAEIVSASQPVERVIVSKRGDQSVPESSLTADSTQTAWAQRGSRLAGDGDGLDTQKPLSGTVDPPIPIWPQTSLLDDPSEVAEKTLKAKASFSPEKADPSIQSYSELPLSFKQSLPALKISLHYYNSDPAKRIVRINNQLLHENERVSDRLLVHEIKKTTVVLGYGESLFELTAPGR